MRGGTTRSAVVLGGQRIAIKRPRARSLEQGELDLPAYLWAANADPLDAATMASRAAGVSTRRYARTLDALPPPEQPRSVSKSTVSRRWVALTQEQLHEWLSCALKQLDLVVVMIDGIHFRERASWWLWASTLRATSMCWGCARARPRTPASCVRC